MHFIPCSQAEIVAAVLNARRAGQSRQTQEKAQDYSGFGLKPQNTDPEIGTTRLARARERGRHMERLGKSGAKHALKPDGSTPGTLRPTAGIRACVSDRYPFESVV